MYFRLAIVLKVRRVERRQFYQRVRGKATRASADAGVGVRLHLVRGEPEERRHHLGGALAIVCDHAGELEQVDLELVVAVAASIDASSPRCFVHATL